VGVEAGQRGLKRSYCNARETMRFEARHKGESGVGTVRDRVRVEEVRKGAVRDEQEG